MEFQKIVSGVLVSSMLFGLVAADLADPTANIQSGICGLYTLVNQVLTAVIFLLIVAAAIVYAGGQLLGAETRARATVWATSMFMGALIGVLIYVIVPYVLNLMVPNGLQNSCG
ncbi:MAG: hypothetical protein QXH30_00655 [Candidatus Bilamarchaeaceae archaeon]